MRPPGPTRRPHADGGFTLVEVLVAMTLLVISLFATLSLLDTSSRATGVSKQRDGANALAQEMLERAQGGRYYLKPLVSPTGVAYYDARNDMTDVDPAATTPGPADRLRAALDPDGTGASSAVSPPTVTSGSVPNLTPQSWTVTRRSTAYTVSYRACTTSDVYQQVQIQGPFDCDRSATNPGNNNTATSGACTIGALAPKNFTPANPGDLTVQLALLGITGANVCVGALAPDLAAGVCTLAGVSPIVDGLKDTLIGTNGVATGLLGSVGSGAAAGICSSRQAETDLLGLQPAIATSTRLAVTVSWRDLNGRQQTVTQGAVVRRATS